MPDQKGRSGKKPKYQIPDIGGSDLTAEDLSTERVLNFLIKGEAPSPEQADSPGAVATEESDFASASAPSQPVQNKAPGASLPSSGPIHKKSLAHLFKRASSGGSVAKDLPLQLPSDERAEPPPPSKAPPETVPSAKDTGRTELTANSVVDQTARAIEQAPHVTEPLAQTSPELAHYIELWKNFYRLKTGEVDALSAMYRLSHGQGREECYIKMHSLAEMSNLTYRYCQKVVRSLEQLGWITKVKDYDPADQRGVLYRVNLKPSTPLP